MEDGSASGGSGTTVELEINLNPMNMEVGIEGSDDSELELGLGLGLSLAHLGSRNLNLIPTASNNNLSLGTKRAASPTGPSQVVGWPPVKAHRMNSMANQPKSTATEDQNGRFEDGKGKYMVYGTDEKEGNAKSKERIPVKSSLFVKVRMDGVPIGRKVDLNAHSSYESLAQTLDGMFINTAIEKSNASELDLMPKVTRPSKLLNGSSEHVLTYEDKDGDWMLVGDVPWRMFVSSVKRLRIMRTSEANGLSPKSEERSSKQSRRPI